MVATPSPSSIRFEPRVFSRLSAFVAAQRDLSLSSATSRLVDEALRMREHPLITFKDGPAGRRARLAGGPDVWEVIGAIRSAREAEPALAGDQVVAVVAETSGVPVPFIRGVTTRRRLTTSCKGRAPRPHRHRRHGNGNRTCWDCERGNQQRARRVASR